MKKRNAHPAAARGVFCAWLCAVLFLLAGCAGAPTEPMEATPSPTLLHATASPAPTLANDPAALYTNVLTDQRVISLVLEGYVNDDLMAGVLETLKSENVPAVFFFSGVTADEHADMVRKIAQAGFEIGNYGLNAQKKMEKNAIPVNLHQFQRGQELLAQATGETPVLFRCNGSVYTQELLQAAAYAGLQAGVLPNVFINHASFQTYADAKAYVQKLARGAVVSVKLGQALDAGEYEGVEYTIAQANNAFIFPGLGLGVSVCRASRVTDGMIGAAAQALASLVRISRPGQSILPALNDLRRVSATVAIAVAKAAEA